MRINSAFCTVQWSTRTDRGDVEAAVDCFKRAATELHRIGNADDGPRIT